MDSRRSASAIMPDMPAFPLNADNEAKPERLLEPSAAPIRASTRGPIALILTVVGVLSRLLPHPPNFAPVDSVSLFAGARLSAWQAYLVPLAIMTITDPILALYYGVHPFTRWQLFTYSSLLICVWIGRRVRSTQSYWRIGTAAVACSVVFFAITNFGVWATSSQFSATSAGLFQCYVFALPFYKWTLASDLFYTAVLFSLHAWLSRLAAARRLPITA